MNLPSRPTPCPVGVDSRLLLPGLAQQGPFEEYLQDFLHLPVQSEGCQGSHGLGTVRPTVHGEHLFEFLDQTDDAINLSLSLASTLNNNVDNHSDMLPKWGGTGVRRGNKGLLRRQGMPSVSPIRVCRIKIY